MNKAWKLLIFSTLLTFNANAAMQPEEESNCCCNFLNSVAEWYNESYFHDNFNVVREGQLYRSAILTADRLEYYIKQNPKIKTIINLRNEQPNAEWYQDEIRICHENNVQLISLETACDKHIKREVFEQLLHLFRTVQKPILIHDKGGVTRTGEIAALWLITNWDINEMAPIFKKMLYDEKAIQETFNGRTEIALEQLSLWYLHIDWLHPKIDFVRKAGNAFTEMIAAKLIQDFCNQDPFLQVEFLASFLDVVYANSEDKKTE